MWKSALPEGSTQEDVVDAGALPEHVAPRAPAERRGFFDSLMGGSKASRGAQETEAGGFSMMISAPFNVQHNIHVQVRGWRVEGGGRGRARGGPALGRLASHRAYTLLCAAAPWAAA